MTNQGPLQCEKIIEVVDTKQNVAENSCGIQIDDFKDVKVTESVISFFPLLYFLKSKLIYINCDEQNMLKYTL